MMPKMGGEMKENEEISKRFFVNKYTVIYIYINSIISYFILNFLINNQKIIIPLIFRAYYITLSIVLFILLKQVGKFNKKYVSKITVIFFSLIIFITSTGFIININEKYVLRKIIKYIDFDKENILLIETFASYALSEYYYKKKELKKISYSIVF